MAGLLEQLGVYSLGGIGPGEKDDFPELGGLNPSQ